MVGLAQKCACLYSVKVAEALAVFEGIQLAFDSGLWPISVESNSLVVVNLIASKIVPLSDVGTIIYDILQLMDSNPGIFIAYIGRKSNTVTHVLAQHCTSVEGVLVWLEDDIPPQ
ncbi:hypothetical protein ACOSQ2_015143 [Xanthoceras sorbifolium]